MFFWRNTEPLLKQARSTAGSAQGKNMRIGAMPGLKYLMLLKDAFHAADKDVGPDRA